MKAREIANVIESGVPLDYQEGYDNSGLIIDDPLEEIRGILIGVDVTEKMIEEAVARGCNMIVAHHPLMFGGIKKLAGNDCEQRVIARMIRERISMYALHTSLDNSFMGLNNLLCSKLDITERKILSPQRDKLFKLVTFCPAGHAENVRKALFSAGAGQIGNYDSCSFNLQGQGSFRALKGANPFVGEIDRLHVEEETRIEVIFPRYLEKDLISELKRNHPYEEVAYDVYPLANLFDQVGAGMTGVLEQEVTLVEFLGKLKGVTKIPVIRYSGDPQKRIKKVALCTGSGAFLIEIAAKERVDLFITSDLKYHDFFRPSNGMALADAGHFETEQFAREWIYSFLNEKFPNFALFISETSTNPVNYY